MMLCSMILLVFSSRLIIFIIGPVCCVSVSRLHCESESFKMDLILDVNTQIYPMDLGGCFSTLHLPLPTIRTMVFCFFPCLLLLSWLKFLKKPHNESHCHCRDCRITFLVITGACTLSMTLNPGHVANIKLLYPFQLNLLFIIKCVLYN